MSAGLFDDPDNPSEEDLLSNPKVAVSPVADQAEWIEKTIAGEETDTGDAETMPEKVNGADGADAASAMEAEEAGQQMPVSLWIILGSVIIVAGAAAWRFSRK